MRILKVSLLNLNSLRGEHTVNFDAEPLASAGLFAITGPTGAGKTTLLDAITLGLFGRVVRYENEARPEFVMSRGTGESRAEVTFSVKGRTYTARWSLARARGKVDGKLQQPKREVSDEQGELVADSVTTSADFVEKVIGLDYPRFMRSVMLAQGQFSRFLTSEAGDRAKLLESLTGTEIYARLGELAYNEAQAREDGIRDRMSRIDSIVVLAPEQRAEQEAVIAKATEDQAAIKNRLEEVTRLRGQVDSLLKAEASVAKEEDNLKTLSGQQAQNRQDQARLEAHHKAAPHVDAIVRHDSAVAKIDDERQAYQQAKDDREGAAETLGDALANFRKALADVAKERQRDILDAEKVKKTVEAKALSAQKWIKANERDAILASRIASLAGAIKQRQTVAKALSVDWKAWVREASGLHAKGGKVLPGDVVGLDSAGFAKSIEAYFKEVDPMLARKRQELAELREQLALKQDHLQKTLLLQSLEDKRAQLKDGEPCALCGSKHHPYAKDGHKFAPASQVNKDFKQAVQRVEELDEEVKSLDGALRQLRKDAEKLRKTHASALDAETDLAAQFKKAGLAEADADIGALQARANAYAGKVGELGDARREAKQQDDIIKDAQGILANVAKEQARIAKVPAGVKVVAPDRGEIDPDDAEESFDEANEEFKRAEAAMGPATKSLKAAEVEMQVSQRLIDAAASKAGFRTVKALKEARLDQREVARIEKAKGQIESLILAAQTRLKSAQSTITELARAGVPRGAKAQVIQGDYDRLMEQNEGLVTQITDAKGVLRRDEAAVEERERLRREIGEEGKMVETWRLLRELIGSADGAKFRKIAQSITLDLLIRHANRHMLQLSDRYSILREPPSVDSKGKRKDDELGLIVEDHYQADAQRPMASLSGGESFLASLALALGLSDLASRSVRIETLFIDEGFGTLDPETLDVALTALEGLREGNKSVGIISHVEALKERIATQIVVKKSASGFSTIDTIPKL